MSGDWSIDERMPSQLHFESLAGPPEQVKRAARELDLRVLPYRQPCDYGRRQVQLLVEHRCELRWVLREALEFINDDPLGDQPPARPEALLAALLAPDLQPWWQANPGAADELQRACALVLVRAADPDPELAATALDALKRCRESGVWPWPAGAPPESSERWTMPEDPPLDRKVSELEPRHVFLCKWRLENDRTRRLSEARGTPLAELTGEQLRLLIEAHLGLPWVLPQALHRVESDPVDATARHPGGLLIALLNLRLEVVWRSNPELVARLGTVLSALERRAADPDPALAQGPYALLERLARLNLYPWNPGDA